ncbi:MAG: tetratricopeptide repeat protein [Nibricoccus sp.]
MSRLLPFGPRFQALVFCLFIVAAIFLVYGGIVEHPFHNFDDPIYVTNNYYVQHGLTLEGVEWAFRSLDGANWHPLTWLSHMLDIEVFGHKPAGHYFTNILLHCIASLLLFLVVLKIGKNTILAFAVALLWAIHPANVECVAWISQRKALLSDCFIFGGMLAYSNYKNTRGRIVYLVCIMMQMLASMSKPTAVLFPVALCLIDFSEPCNASFTGNIADFMKVSGRNLRGLLFNKLPFIFIAGYLSVLTFVAQDGSGATGYTYKHTLARRCGNALESLFDYTVKAFSTPETSILYVIRPLIGLRVFYGVVVLILLVLAAIAAVRRVRAIAVGVGWYLLMFLPTIGLVQVGSQRLADRYLNLPLIGLIVAVCLSVWVVFIHSRFRYMAIVALSAWALGLGFQARSLCVNWGDDLRLSLNGIAVGGRSFSMLLNCSASAIQRKHYEEARRYLAMATDEAKAMQNLAVIDMYEGKFEEALAKARRLLGNKETRLVGATIAGNALTSLQRHGDARRAYKAAIDLLPPNRTYLLNMEELRSSLPAMEAREALLEKKGLDERVVKPEAGAGTGGSP